jgi:hypothetical protein
MAKGTSGLQHPRGLPDGAMTDVDPMGDGTLQRGKDGNFDGGRAPGGDGIVGSPMRDSGDGSGLPTSGDPVMSALSGLGETPNTMSGMPPHVEGDNNLGPGDPGPGGQVPFEDLGGSVAGRTVPTKELTDFGKR